MNMNIQEIIIGRYSTALPLGSPLLTLGAHAQRGLQYLVCVSVLSVCLSVCVYDYSRTTGYEAAYERYKKLQCYKKNNVAILLKRLRSRDMA